MTPRDFCYWLQGWLELQGHLSKKQTLSPAIVKEIRRHLALVFQRVKPKKRGKDWREIEYCAKSNPLKCTPKFPSKWLKKLDDFEKRSRKSRFLVK